MPTEYLDNSMPSASSDCLAILQYSL